MAIPYRMPQNNSVISSSAMGRESQEEMLRNAALLGRMGPDQAIAAGGGGMTRGPNGSSIPLGMYRSMGMGQGGGYGGGGNFFDQWNSAYNTARSANENRYDAIRGGGPTGGGAGGAPSYGGRVSARHAPQQQGMTGDQAAARGGYAGRFDRNMGRLETLGAQEKADVSQRYDQQAAAGQQSLTNRGLANSTILNTMKLGTQREKSDALSRVNERLQNQRINTDAQLSGDTLQFMERRTDAYPDQRLYAEMAQRFGQSGGGGNGGGGGYGGGGVQFADFGGMGFGGNMGGGWGGPGGQGGMGGFGGGMGGGWGAYPMGGGGGSGGGHNYNSLRYTGPQKNVWPGTTHSTANSSAYLPAGYGKGAGMAAPHGLPGLYGPALPPKPERDYTALGPTGGYSLYYAPLDDYWSFPRGGLGEAAYVNRIGRSITDTGSAYYEPPPGRRPSTGVSGGYSMGAMPGFGPASSDPAGLFPAAGGYHGMTDAQLRAKVAQNKENAGR